MSRSRSGPFEQGKRYLARAKILSPDTPLLPMEVVVFEISPSGVYARVELERGEKSSWTRGNDWVVVEELDNS